MRDFAFGFMWLCG